MFGQGEGCGCQVVYGRQQSRYVTHTNALQPMHINMNVAYSTLPGGKEVVNHRGFGRLEEHVWATSAAHGPSHCSYVGWQGVLQVP